MVTFLCEKIVFRQTDTLPGSIATIYMCLMLAKQRNHHVSQPFLFLGQFQIDSPMRPEDWQKRGMISHFTVMRKLEGSIFPIGLAKEASDKNQKAGSNVLALESR
jgi:DNA polymerase alpha subunit A